MCVLFIPYKEHSESSHLRCVSTPSMASSTVISFRQQDFGTLKLFRHLQSRVKQLRAENRIYHGTGLEDVNTLHIEAGNSYKKMVSRLLASKTPAIKLMQNLYRETNRILVWRKHPWDLTSTRSHLVVPGHLLLNRRTVPSLHTPRIMQSL